MLVGYWIVRRKLPDKLLAYGRASTELPYSVILARFRRAFPKVDTANVTLTLDQTEEMYQKVLRRQAEED